MHNKKITGTVLDVPTNSGIEKLFLYFPEMRQINLKGIEGVVIF